MGGQEKCNTYDKYSYQEMIDLNQKIKKFREQKLSYEEIKNKIASKSNKIISFGQTPFKLFEDKHQAWAPEKGNKEDQLKIENEMREAAKNLDFEKAMELRDILFELKSE